MGTAVARTRLAGHVGLSGASLERILLPDGTRLIVKKLSPLTDFIMRRAHDDGRLQRMWDDGVFQRMPPAIDHAMLGVERDRDELTVVMRDRTDTLVGDRMLTREQNRRILGAASAVYEAFWEEDIRYLCSLRDWVARFRPSDVDADHPLREMILRGWERFPDVVPADVAAAVSAIHEDPQPIARALGQRERSLVHGDLRLANIGLTRDRVVLLDWGSFTAMAPSAMEFAWYLAISWAQIQAPIADIVADFRDLSGERFDARALDLGFLLALAHLGWSKATAATEQADEAARARERDHVDWWVAQVRRALESWSPT